MLVEDDSDIIMISFADFKEQYKSFNKQNIRNSLLIKQQELYNNHKCFHSKFESQISNYVEKKHYGSKSRETYVPKPVNRLHIISTNFDDSTKIKKSFVSNLNKLSPKNKDNLVIKIRDIIKNVKDSKIENELYLIIWDFIKKSYDSSYIDVINLYDKQTTDNYWNTYIKNKDWYPEDYVIQNNILSSCNDMYDLYCNYVTWKKQITNVNKFWCLIHHEMNCLDKFDHLLNDLIYLFNEYSDNPKKHKHIIDFALEQILIILKTYKNKNIINIFKELDTSNLESSSKFIILDIVELN
jgi:hypothetical protein